MSEGPFPGNAPPRPIRFGILCDGPKIPTWQARSIEELRRVPGTSLALLAFNPEGSFDGSRRGEPAVPRVCRIAPSPGTPDGGHDPRVPRRPICAVRSDEPGRVHTPIR